MKKTLAFILTLVMLVSIAAVSAMAEPLKLTMYFPVNVGGNVANLIDSMTAEFNAENPDIQVEAVYTGNYDDTVTAIQTAIQGGNAPDPVREPGDPALHDGLHQDGHASG